MQNDIENILNEIASKDSQVLCREVLSIGDTMDVLRSKTSHLKNPQFRQMFGLRIFVFHCNICYASSRFVLVVLQQISQLIQHTRP